MISINRLQDTQLAQDYYALIRVMSGAAGVAIGLVVAGTLGWLS
ncbi:MAG TPA: hypothetical protein V6D03_03150 [Candidatus Caenarcaniphilales bacterium]